MAKGNRGSGGYRAGGRGAGAWGAESGRGAGAWGAESVRALRRHLGLSQTALAAELGTRQQTVSEWETGLYAPRGASVRLLTIVAERAGFRYEARSDKPSGEP